MSGRGRKRKLRARYASGQLVRKSRIDTGTSELMQKRAVIASDFPLTDLLAKGEINQDQHDAGMRFARNYWALFGQPFCRAQNFVKSNAVRYEGGAEANVRRQYEADLRKLAKSGAVSLVTDVAVFLRQPPENSIALLRSGLEVLSI